LSHQLRETERQGLSALELTSPSGLTASYVPGAGMVCCSLRCKGEELLGQRKGLAAYAARGSTMGIPLLHPWANRLGRMGYALGGTRVELPADSPLIHDDGNGLPIHGLTGGCPHWRVLEREADAKSARLLAELDFAARPELMALFPFAHTLRMHVTLTERTLEIETTLRASGDTAVPVAFGYHPYFQLPGLPRAQWQVTLPVRRRALLDPGCLPTGRTEPFAVAPGPLGDRVYDDLFPEIEPNPTFVLAGGDRRIEVRFGDAYRVAVVYAPANDDVVCFEPMTAPTNPFEGGGDLAWVQPGASFSARFSIHVA
jgi:aldose 1-epimerase